MSQKSKSQPSRRPTDSAGTALPSKKGASIIPEATRTSESGSSPEQESDPKAPNYQQQGLPPNVPNRFQVGYWMRRITGQLHHLQNMLDSLVQSHNQAVTRVRMVSDTNQVVQRALKAKGLITDDDLRAAYESIVEEIQQSLKEEQENEARGQEESIGISAADGASENIGYSDPEVPSAERKNLHIVSSTEGSEGSRGE